MFIDLLKKTGTDDAEPQFLEAVMESAPFWNSALRLMKKMGKEPDE